LEIMMTVLRNSLGAFLCLALLATTAGAGEPVGEVLSARAELYGGNGNVRSVLGAGDPIHFLDRLSTNATGIGEFILDDGTKLALGPSGSVVVDQFVRKGGSGFSRLGTSVAKGAFRWISGQSTSAAYEINTPTGTMGIRGTALDVTTLDGVTHIVLLNGGARFCAGEACEVLTATGDYITASGQTVSRPVDVRTVFTTKADAAAVFPFLANPGLLSAAFRVPGSNTLSNLSLNQPGRFLRGGSNPGASGLGGLANAPAGLVATGAVAAAGGLAAALSILSSMEDADDEDQPITPD
jgi:hypothetical protein